MRVVTGFIVTIDYVTIQYRRNGKSRATCRPALVTDLQAPHDAGSIRCPFPGRRRFVPREREYASSSRAEHLTGFGEVRMTGRDEYYNRSKQEGYRSRAAYKLQQLDGTADLFSVGDVVVDLGAAPGGWLQVASEAVGTGGRVVGVDLQRIDPLEAENVATVRGDMTEESTRDRLREALGADPDDRPVDVVVSDMAPNMTGQYTLDHARSVHLARQAFTVAQDVLAPGGDFVAKVFDGPDLDDLHADIGEAFQYVREVRPDASRDASSELYLVGKGRVDAPVADGEELEVEVVDVGSEGDGVAKVEGYTLFVPGTEPGDRLRVRVSDVKPRYGFADPIDGPDAAGDT
jgi:23S rRNA (uridine2552-2'-O)-methyltransferase